MADKTEAMKKSLDPAVRQMIAEAEAKGLGAANFGGMMIDAATTRLFQVTLDRARQCGLID